MEELKYSIEDYTLAELLGTQNFINKESAILELVKNAFDSNSSLLNIVFTNDAITISDIGIGMNSSDIKLHWMHVGKSNKGYRLPDDNNNTSRILAGEKGIGRFALARLGNDISIFSKKNNSEAILWKTDWHKSTLETTTILKKTGTKIIIEKLRDKWTKTSIENLRAYLDKTYNDTAMKIFIKYNDSNIEIKPIFSNAKMGKNYASRINLAYSNKNHKLKCSIISDEFKDIAKFYTGGININTSTKTINIYDIFKHSDLDTDDEDLQNLLTELGSFSAELYFGIDRSTKNEVERFLYKRSELQEKYKTGIILYRNSFSLASYEGKRDWLELGKRSRKSPAAATHPTGSWRVRENQLSGKVVIDKQNNKNLRDLSNRQGLEENKYYELFIAILQKGLEEFESYRQSIIRKINKKNKPQKEDENLFEKIVTGKINLNSLDEESQKKLLTELQSLQKTLKGTEETEKRYKYDVRILNVLATVGLKAASLAHEMRNDKNAIESNYEFIREALLEYKIWDMLNDEDHTQYGYQNVPALLLRNKEINRKIIIFMNTMLNEIEKKKFFAEKYNIYELLNKLSAKWKKDYSWINTEIQIDKTDTYTLSEDVIDVIFDNLILNSIQQNDNLSSLNIKISAIVENDYLIFTYKDNGRGLHKKYLHDTFKILEVHETTRKNGHGLGMWIVNNTIEMCNGKITDIAGEKGFQITFCIKGDL